MQVHTSLWFLASQFAPGTHGLLAHRGWHDWTLLSQLSLSLQSESLLQPTGMQATYGFPCSPCSHEHLALWKSVLHWAFFPQLVEEHGSMHSSDMHALSRGQSGFFWHSSKSAKKIRSSAEGEDLRGETYIGSKAHVDFQPNLRDTDILLCGWRPCSWPPSHRVHEERNMGLGKNPRCRICSLGSPCQRSTLLTSLENFTLKSGKMQQNAQFSLSYVESIPCRHRRGNQGDMSNWLCDCWRCKFQGCHTGFQRCMG